MRSRALGKSGIEASVVGLGTWAIGGWMWGGVDQKQAICAIHAALDAGINFIDTAPIYGFGLSEEIVGRAIADRRSHVVLATKCGMVCDPTRGKPSVRSTALGPNPNGHIAVNILLAPDSIRREVEASLRRLSVETIDLYQTHWQDPTTPIAETMETLLALKKEGKIRAIGVSNATASQMGNYEAVGKLDSDQEKFSLLDRDKEKDQLPYCRKHQIAFLAYSPLALGLLTGKISPEKTFGAGDLRLANPRFKETNLKKVSEMLQRVHPLAEKYNATLSQLIIAWTIQQRGVTHALCGARTVDHALENARAGNLELSADDLAEFDRLVAPYIAELSAISAH